MKCTSCNQEIKPVVGRWLTRFVKYLLRELNRLVAKYAPVKS